MNYKRAIPLLLSTVMVGMSFSTDSFANDFLKKEKSNGETIVSNLDNMILEDDKEKSYLNLGEEKQEDGKITFPNAKANLGKSGILKISFINKKKVTYILNENNVETYDNNIEIPIREQCELNEVINSLNIYNDEKSDIFKISLISNDCDDITKKFTVTGEYRNSNKPENATDNNFDTYWQIGGYNGYLEFNNDNRLNVKSITGKTANSSIVVEGLKDGVWEKIGNTTVLNWNELTEVEIKDGIYDAFRVYSNGGEWSNFREVQIIGNEEVSDYAYMNIDNIQNKLIMGNYENDNGTLSFSNTIGVIIKPTNLYISFTKGFNTDVKTTWSKNKVQTTKNTKDIKIPIKTQAEFDEVIKSLRIKTNKTDLDFNIKLAELPAESAVTANKSAANGDIYYPTYDVSCAIDDDLDTHFASYSEDVYLQIDFNSPKKVDSISWRAYLAIGGKIKGYTGYAWEEIANVEYEDLPLEYEYSGADSIINNSKTINVKVKSGIYTKLRIYPDKYKSNGGARICDVVINGTQAEHFNYNYRN
ncbi:hypothetical protein ACTPDI_03150 [Clostridioides difficile]|nr:hypothetical protein [Clostridioides difficile]MDB0438488.1 hypothetical protein [Clostridioides difficile]